MLKRMYVMGVVGPIDREEAAAQIRSADFCVNSSDGAHYPVGSRLVVSDVVYRGNEACPARGSTVEVVSLESERVALVRVVGPS